MMLESPCSGLGSALHEEGGGSEHRDILDLSSHDEESGNGGDAI